jgi:LPLT family lysophospholipid transporter-like MFS transporter
LHSNPIYLLRDFAHCMRLLWFDKLGQITLAVTTLFWGAGATLQFILLRWAEEALSIPLYQATYLQVVFAFGIAFGAILAGKLIRIDRSVSVIGVGIAMGITAMLMAGVHTLVPAIILVMLVGAMAGFFVVPMNALLQHRGHILMGAGHSIAVQNFNENLSILVMLALYAMLVASNLSIQTVVLLFGGFISVSMFLVFRWHQFNMRAHKAELEHLLAIAAAGHHRARTSTETTGRYLQANMPTPRKLIRGMRRIAARTIKPRRR